MGYNLQKFWITMLYAWNWQNIVNQLYFNLKKKRKKEMLSSECNEIFFKEWFIWLHQVLVAACGI